MARRTLVPVVLVALLAGLVLWVSLRVGSEPRASELAGPTTSAPADSSARDTHAPVLAQASRAELASPPDAAAADASAARAAITASEKLADAVWLDGRVEFPLDTPRDERAQVVAFGRKIGDKNEHRFDVGPDDRFRVAFAPDTKKGSLRVEGRYVFSPETLTIQPASPPEPLVLPTALGGVLRVRLVPSELAEPRRAELANAKVTAYGWVLNGDNARQRHGEANDEHVCELLALDPAARWSVQVQLAGFAGDTEATPSIEAGKVADLEFKLFLAARLAGSIVDETGAPVPKARINVKTRVGDSTNYNSGEAADAAGRFDLASLKFGSTTLEVKTDGFLPGEAGPFELSEGVERTDVVITLKRGNSVAGRVLWPDGKPAEKATVEVVLPEDESEHFSAFGVETRGTRTAADGTFTLSGLAEGPFTVAARARKRDGAMSARVDWTARAAEVAAGTTGLELVLALGAALRGVVVDDVGAPVGGALVRAEPLVEDGRRPQTARSDGEDGRFELASVGHGEWKVLASKAPARDSSTERIELPRDAARELRLVLPRAAVIAGVVLDPAGRPVPRAKLRVDRDRSAFRSWSSEDESKLADEAGRFEIERVMPGGLELRASAPEWASAEPLKLDLAPGQRLEGLVVQLRRGGTIEGRVLDAEDRPLQGALVSTWAQGSDDSRRAQTGADGSYRLEHVGPGQSWVSVEHDASPLPEHERSRNVTVDDGAVVRADFGGRNPNALRVTGVVRAREPLASAKMWWSLQGPGGSHGGGASSETDASGNYSATLSSAGTYVVHITGPDDDWNASTSRTVEVPAGGGRIDFDLPTGAIEGRVLSADGKPVAGVAIEIKTPPVVTEEGSTTNTRHTRSGAGGRFKIEHGEPGEYVARAIGRHEWEDERPALAEHAPGEAVTIQLGAGERRTGVELRLGRAGRIEGVAYLPDGRPAAGAKVGCAGLGGRVTDCDAAGKFRFDGLPPETFTLRASTAGGNVSKLVKIEVRAGETVQARLDLVQGGQLVVQLLDASGAPFRATKWMLPQVVDATGETWEFQDFQSDSLQTGAYRYRALPPGDYEVRMAFGELTIATSAKVVAGGEATIPLRAPE